MRFAAAASLALNTQPDMLIPPIYSEASLGLNSKSVVSPPSVRHPEKEIPEQVPAMKTPTPTHCSQLQPTKLKLSASAVDGKTTAPADVLVVNVHPSNVN
jgi:hypothetical protein